MIIPAKLQVDQLSIVVRWVSVAGEEVKIEESFLGFVPMNSGTAQVIADTALDLLNELGFSLDKLRGQVSVSFFLQCRYIENAFIFTINYNHGQ